MKKIALTIILLLTCCFVNAQVKVIAPIVTNSPFDTTYGTGYDTLMIGGYMAVQDIASRNRIPLSRRKNGMMVATASDGKNWTLVNGQWQPFISGASTLSLDSLRMDVAVLRGYAATIDTNLQNTGLNTILERGNIATNKNILFNMDDTIRQVRFSTDGYRIMDLKVDPNQLKGELSFYDQFGVAKRDTRINTDSVIAKYISIPNTVSASVGIATIRNAINTAYNATFTLPNTLGANKTFAMAEDIVANNEWDNTYKVTGSDFTTTSATATNITPLTTSTLSPSSVYQFEAVLRVSTSVASKSVYYAINCTGSGSTGTANFIGNDYSSTSRSSSTVFLNFLTEGFNTINPANIVSTMIITGTFETGTGSPVFSIQTAVAASATVSIKLGSTLKIKKVI